MPTCTVPKTTGKLLKQVKMPVISKDMFQILGTMIIIIKKTPLSFSLYFGPEQLISWPTNEWWREQVFSHGVDFRELGLSLAICLDRKMLFCKTYLMCCFNLITPRLVMYCLRCGARKPKLPKLARSVCNVYLWLDGVELLPVLRRPGWSWLEQDLRSKYLHLWQGCWKYLFNLSICFFFLTGSD